MQDLKLYTFAWDGHVLNYRKKNYGKVVHVQLYRLICLLDQLLHWFITSLNVFYDAVGPH